MKWEKLDSTAEYKIRVVYNGPFGVRIKCATDDEYLIRDFTDQADEDILQFSIPEASTKDGI